MSRRRNVHRLRNTQIFFSFSHLSFLIAGRALPSPLPPIAHVQLVPSLPYSLSTSPLAFLSSSCNFHLQHKVQHKVPAVYPPSPARPHLMQTSSSTQSFVPSISSLLSLHPFYLSTNWLLGLPHFLLSTTSTFNFLSVNPFSAKPHCKLPILSFLLQVSSISN